MPAPVKPRRRNAYEIAAGARPLKSGHADDDGAAATVGCKAVSIAEQRSFEGRTFPLTIAPAEAMTASLAEWSAAHHGALLALIEKYDAVLLRGFCGSATAMNFSRFASALELGPFAMGCSAAPRTNVAPGVFTANEAPPSEPIPFHHEMAQCMEPPAYVFFFCERPAASGGATPIIPSYAVADHLQAHHPAVADRMRRLGVRYVRTLPEHDDPSSPLGKGWRASYMANSREEAEAAMEAAGIEYTWLDGGDVRTVTPRMPALVHHDATGREMFFNAVVAATQGWIDVRNDSAQAVVYGDGTALDAEARVALESVGAYLRDHCVAFAWQAGDVLLLDNRKALHSRQSYEGPRRVLASLWAPPPGKDLPVTALPPWTASDESGHAGLARARSPTMHSLTLRSGAKMPAVGLGLWKVPKDVCADTVVCAIRAGYRHLDSACDYGNEVQVGEGIRRAMAEGLVTRDELWVTSKLWNTYHAAEHVEAACRKTLADLGLDYVDLYL